MPTPVLHLLAGCNGAGKSTLAESVIRPDSRLPFINADLIAAAKWPEAQAEHAYDASRIAASMRHQLLESRTSFITETVFSHPSKLQLVEDAHARGYLVELHAVMIPVDLALLRVSERVRRGGHDVPENKVRERYDRLWPLVARAIVSADRATVYDNSRSLTPLRVVAIFENGTALEAPAWPAWTPQPLRSLVAE